jgi:hypothetical protein
MGILELTIGSVVVGFFTVFGWNSGNIVWDRYIEPAPVVQSADADEPREKRERH